MKEFKEKFRYNLNDELSQSLIDRLVRMDEYKFLNELVNTNSSLDFSHEKPYYAQNTGNKMEENLGPNKWNQQDHLNVETLLNNVAHNPATINSLHKSLWDQVKFTKFKSDEIENLISNESSFAFITTPKFMKRVSSFINSKFKDKNYGGYYTIPSNYFDKMTLAQMDTLKKECTKAGKDLTFKGKYFEKTYHYFFQDPEFYQ